MFFSLLAIIFFLQILGDSDNKAHYDQFGTINTNRDNDHQHHHHDNPFRGFEGFFHRSHNFHFNEENSRKNPEEAINKRLYEETIFPNSHKKPFFIYTFTDFCFTCFKIEPLWNEFKQELKNIGIGYGHLDASWNRELSRNLGINNVPSIVAIVNRKVFHFNGDYQLKAFREFVRNIFPSNLVTEVSNLFVFTKPYSYQITIC